MNKELHIVSFDVPYPPDYGGSIDIFYKIKALYKFGYNIKLHCFQYGREKQKTLNKYCQEVFYYKRKLSKIQLLHYLPFIIKSRDSKELLKNLKKDESPILFEGHHSCYYLNHYELKDRNKIVRTHNIEQEYYYNLSKVENKTAKKYYLLLESKKLKYFEKTLEFSSSIISISQEDQKYYQKRFKKVEHISAFHPFNKVESKVGLGMYSLYHGNLEVAENNTAALFLVNKVFNSINEKLIIIGNNPSRELEKRCKKSSNIELIKTKESKKIYQLVVNAHINILPTFQATGLKLKLLTALYLGRFCLVNKKMIKGTGLEKTCIVKDTPNSLKKSILNLMTRNFKKNDFEIRKNILESFSNQNNIKKLNSVI